MSSYDVGLILQNFFAACSQQLKQSMLIRRCCCLQVQLGYLYSVVANQINDPPQVSSLSTTPYPHLVLWTYDWKVAFNLTLMFIIPTYYMCVGCVSTLVCVCVWN